MIPLTTDEERLIHRLLRDLDRVGQGPMSDAEKTELVYDLLQEERAKAEQRVAVAVASARTLRAALLRHVEQFGGASHHADDCPNPVTCAECATNRMVEWALSSDTITEVK
jgi:hypothetical protein